MKLMNIFIIIFISLYHFGYATNISIQKYSFLENIINYQSENEDHQIFQSLNQVSNQTDIMNAITYLGASYFALVLYEIIPDPEKFFLLIQSSPCLASLISNKTKFENTIRYSAKSFPDYGDEEGCININNAFLLLTLNYSINEPHGYKGKFRLLPFISKGYTFYGLCVDNSYICTEGLAPGLETMINKKQITLNGLESATMKIFIHTKNDKNEKSLEQGTARITFFVLFFIFLFIRIIVWFFGYRFFKEKDEESLNKEKDEDDSSSSEEEEEEQSNSQTVTKEQTDDKKELLEKKTTESQISKKNTYPKFYFFYSMCSFAQSFKLLFKKEGNPIFKENDLELIVFFRFLAFLAKISHYNFNYFMHSPSREINNVDIFDKDIIHLIRYSSFSDVILIMTESTILSYKLMSFLKKYADRREGPSFKLFVNFFLRIIPSLFMVIFLFFCAYFWHDIIISFFIIIGADYFSTRIQYMKSELLKCYDCTQNIKNLIPFYMNYQNFESSTNANTSCFQFMIIMVNLFYCYFFCILLTYISFKIKKKLFDIIISICFIIGFFLPHEFYCDYTNYFNINVVLGEKCSTTFTHLFIKYYFFGYLFGIAIFYDNDITQENSLQISEIYIPFSYLKDLIGFLFKRSVWVHLLIILITISIHTLLSLTIRIFVSGNFSEVYKDFQLKALGKYTYLNEKTYFAFSFGLLLATLYTYKNYAILKQPGSSIFVKFFHRIGYLYYAMIEIIINLIYSCLEFNYSLTNNNLSFVPIGMIAVITIWSVFISVVFYIPVKSLTYKLLHFKKNENIKK